ncbi:MAG: cysteine hydrolase [Nitrososphaeria archaeon]
MINSEDLKRILEPKNSLFIAWDVHRALFNSTFNRDEFLKGFQTALNAARKARVPVIFTKITPFPTGFEPASAKLMQWRGSFRPEDMELIVQPQQEDIVINKNTWSIFVGTNVELLARNSGRSTFVFTGIATDIGVETSVRHAYALGFVPVIISDGVSSQDIEAHKRSLANMQRFFPVISSEELSKIWS